MELLDNLKIYFIVLGILEKLRHLNLLVDYYIKDHLAQ